MHIGIEYLGPKKRQGQKTLSLPVGTHAIWEAEEEVTFKAPKFVCAIAAKYVAALVNQPHFQFASEAEQKKYNKWANVKTAPALEATAPASTPEPEQEPGVVVTVPPPSEAAVAAERAQAETPNIPPGAPSPFLLPAGAVNRGEGPIR